MNGAMDLFGDWVTKGLVWLALAAVLRVLAIHWAALMAGLRGSVGRAVLTLLLVGVVYGAFNFVFSLIAIALGISGLGVVAVQLFALVAVQSVAMLLLYRAELPRALLASFLSSILGVALLTPLTLLFF